MWEDKGRKKAKKVLEKWPHIQESSPKGSSKGKPVKRLKEAAKRMEGNSPQEKGGLRQSLLEKWLRKEKEGLEASLGPRKERIDPKEEPEPP